MSDTFEGLKAPWRPRQLASLGEITEAQWDALFAPGYPFTRHAFLKALEDHGCVGPRTGWEPCHLVLEDAAGSLAAAMPLYRKRHSYGEFVFDFGWARAAQRLGLPYYPKLLCAIPFTPAAGPRLGARDGESRAALVEAASRAWQTSALGSIHALFLDDGDAQACAGGGWLERHDVQFHWSRRGATSFEDFLGQLSHSKRQKIRRERRRVAEAGIRFAHRRGDELSEAQWARVYALYANTYEERGQPPYLAPEFFLDYGRRPGTPLRLVLGYDGGDEAMAVAITLAGGDTLYGRHWGCAEKYRGLHFETCYYQGIELCLAEGLSRFDAGTQGPHKLARGFEPVITRSAHRIADERLAAAVAEFLAGERTDVARRRERLAEHSAYRSNMAAHG
ncbi:MAG: GNAT family N-acetyltransferase [Gammaproteobacteria bacterium]